ncbi:MAG: hypothetical protein MZV64_52590 [Ignavibacteriales bacterium]|nr:hypothetical protein [Ignavibacteriales bacterium]
MFVHLQKDEDGDTTSTATRTDLDRLEELRSIDNATMAAFAADLKARPGSKHAFLFYQREQVPQFNDRKIIEALNSSDSELAFKVRGAHGGL